MRSDVRGAVYSRYRDTGSVFFSGQFVSFEPADTNFTHHRWVFGNGQVFNQKRLWLYFPSGQDSFPVDVMLYATGYRGAACPDTLETRKRIWIYRWTISPTFGRYQGVFWDGAQGEVTLGFQDGEHFLKGFVSHSCGVEQPFLTAIGYQGPRVFSFQSIQNEGFNAICGMDPRGWEPFSVVVIGDSIFAKIAYKKSTGFVKDSITFRGRKV